MHKGWQPSTTVLNSWKMVQIEVCPLVFVSATSACQTWGSLRLVKHPQNPRPQKTIRDWQSKLSKASRVWPSLCGCLFFEWYPKEGPYCFFSCFQRNGLPRTDGVIFSTWILATIISFQIDTPNGSFGVARHFWKHSSSVPVKAEDEDDEDRGAQCLLFRCHPTLCAGDIDVFWRNLNEQHQPSKRSTLYRHLLSEETGNSSSPSEVKTGWNWTIHGFMSVFAFQPKTKHLMIPGF